MEEAEGFYFGEPYFGEPSFVIDVIFTASPLNIWRNTDLFC